MIEALKSIAVPTVADTLNDGSGVEAMLQLKSAAFEGLELLAPTTISRNLACWSTLICTRAFSVDLILSSSILYHFPFLFFFLPFSFLKILHRGLVVNIVNFCNYILYSSILNTRHWEDWSIVKLFDWFRSLANSACTLGRSGDWTPSSCRVILCSNPSNSPKFSLFIYSTSYQPMVLLHPQYVTYLFPYYSISSLSQSEITVIPLYSRMEST